MNTGPIKDGIRTELGRAAARRLKAWAKMNSKQKLADMEKEDRRRKRRRK